MNARRFSTPAAALAIAAALIGGTTPAAAGVTLVGTSYGYGPTLPDAESAAESQLYGDYFGCRPPFFIIDYGQNPNGLWWAEASGNCTGIR